MARPPSLTDSLEESLAAFAEKAGIDDLALDASGAAVVRFGEGAAAVDITIEALEAEGRVLLHAPVLAIAGEPDAALQERLLTLALHGLGTGGGALGWDRSRGEAVLTMSWGFRDIDAARLEALLEATYAAASALREELADEADTGPAGGAARRDEAAGGERMVVIPG